MQQYTTAVTNSFCYSTDFIDCIIHGWSNGRWIWRTRCGRGAYEYTYQTSTHKSEIKKKLESGNRHLGWNSNPEPHEYEVRVLATTPRISSGVMIWIPKTAKARSNFFHIQNEERFPECGDTRSYETSLFTKRRYDLNFNPLNPELNPICYLMALLAHHFLHVSRIRVKSLTHGLLMSYIYIYIYIWSAYSWCF